MLQQSSAAVTPIVPGREAAIRASRSFFLQTVSLLLDMTKGDLVKGVLLISIIHANTELFRRMDASVRSFTQADETIPDDMRQPVSIYALARSLGMPYETTRRYVARLLDEGLCVKVGDRGGIIVPTRILAAERAVALSTRHHGQLMQLVGAVNQISARAA